MEFKHGNITFIHGDCVEYMESMDWKADLAIVDPPYGIKAVQRMYKGRGGYINKNSISTTKKSFHDIKEWDNERPSEAYWNLLFKNSKNQIAWGGNFFTDYLPISRGWIFWDKDVHGDFSKGELAWTSFDTSLNKCLYVWDGMRQGVTVGKKEIKGGNFQTGNTTNIEKRLHPTQKPVPLYKWILTNYAKKGDRIIDTHGGSMSIAIACYDLGFELVCIEKDLDYFNAAVKRFKQHIKQAAIQFPEQPEQPTQSTLQL